jgi:trans-2,3-dihydro-3-hydroxyanthranilate isomerase
VRLGFRIADVFTEVPFAGNQLCVFPDVPADLDPATMQSLAREIAFSESTFVLAAAGDRYRVRIFTPDEEIPFAGHPTLGTAFVLVREGRVSASVTQTTDAGEVHVEIDLSAGAGWMRQLPPSFGAVFDDRALVAAAAGLAADDIVGDLPLQPVSTGLPHLMVPIRDEETLRRAEREGPRCLEVHRRTGAASLYLFTVRGDGDVLARMFDPLLGIGEDPATGSAAGPLGAYLSAHGLAGMPGDVVVSQGEMVGRPSTLCVEVSGSDPDWAVRVGGGVRVVGDGAFEI